MTEQNSKYIDLHTHTTASDASMTPSELVRYAKSRGLAAIAVTDHDTINGLAQAIAEGAKIGLEVVPGVEFSVASETETHILGYDIDISNKRLLETFDALVKFRGKRYDDIQNKLQSLGIDVTTAEALALAPGGLVGRTHFAEVMVRKGYASSIKEAFKTYLDNGRPAYSNIQLLTAREAVEIIKGAGGKAFVAHLNLIRQPLDWLYGFIGELKGYGLDGIEGYYTDYTPELERDYQKLAADLKLKISGGTDFHAAMKPHIEIGTGLGNLKIPYSVLENIRK